MFIGHQKQDERLERQILVRTRNQGMSIRNTTDLNLKAMNLSKKKLQKFKISFVNIFDPQKMKKGDVTNPFTNLGVNKFLF